MRGDELVSFFAPHLSVTLKRMAGGHAVYAEGQIIALESDGDLYLRADAETRPFFEEHGCRQLAYERPTGKVARLRYYRVPEQALQNERLKVLFIAAAVAIAKRGSARRRMDLRLAKRHVG